MRADLEKIRPFSALDNLTARILAVAYKAYASGKTIPAAHLRFEAEANHAQVQRLVDQLHLLSGEAGSTYRPTLLGLLYFDEALPDLNAIDRLLKFARDRYRPDDFLVPPDEVIRAAELEPGQFERLGLLSSELPVGLSPKGPVQLTERSLEDVSLAALVARLKQIWVLGLRNRSGFDPAATQPPFVLRPRGLHVIGFRALQDVDMSFGSLTVLVGPNGVGKSTVLDVFGFLRTLARHARNEFPHGLDGALLAEGGLDRLRTAGESGPVSIDLSFDLIYGAERVVPGRIGIGIGELNGNPLLERETLSLQESASEKYLIRGGRGRAEIVGQTGQLEAVYLGGIETAIGAEIPGSPLIAQIRSALSRIYLLDRDPALRRPPPGIQQNLNRRTRQREMVDPDALIAAIAVDQVAVAKLGDYLRELVPSLNSVDAVHMTGEPTALIFGENGRKGSLAFDELSSGVRQLVLLAAFYVLPSSPTMLLVEEPDAAVHPGVHGALVDLLRSLARKMTVITTTHSPTFVGRLDPEAEVRVLMREEKNARVCSLAEALRSKAWLKAFDSSSEAFLRSTQERQS